MPYEEIKYIDARIEELTRSQHGLPASFQATKAAIDRQIEDLLAKAGVLGQVRVLERKIEEAKTQLQREADKIAGRIEELKLLRARLQKIVDEMEAEEKAAAQPAAPPPPASYPETLYGIRLAPLDDTTRLLVMQGNPETIRVLGGTLPGMTLTRSDESSSTPSGPV